MDQNHGRILLHGTAVGESPESVRTQVSSWERATATVLVSEKDPREKEPAPVENFGYDPTNER
eukprot:scaffold65021_cov87-Cyclotella_meneghiniana.AAC.10